MQAVIVSFHFHPRKGPCDRLMEAHRQLIDRIPGMDLRIMLDGRSEYAFVLTFEERSTLDAYFESEEFRSLSCQPGCDDVFVKAFCIPPADAVADGTISSESEARGDRS